MLKYSAIINKMTEEQKLDCISSIKSLSSRKFVALGIPKLVFCENYKELLGNLPDYSVLSHSWDRHLIHKYALFDAKQVASNGYNVVMFDAMHVALTPYSNGITEDAVLLSQIAGEVNTAYQASGVVACIGDFGIKQSDIEYLDKDFDERLLHEYFLRPIQILSQQYRCRVYCVNLRKLGGQYSTVNFDIVQQYANSFEDNFVICKDVPKDQVVRALKSRCLLWDCDVNLIKIAFEKYKHIQADIDENIRAQEELEYYSERGLVLSTEELDSAVDKVIDFAFYCKNMQNSVEVQFTDEQSKQELITDVANRTTVLLRNSNVLPLKENVPLKVIVGNDGTNSNNTETHFIQSLKSISNSVEIIQGYDETSFWTKEGLLSDVRTDVKNADTVVVLLRNLYGNDTYNRILAPCQQELIKEIKQIGAKVIAVFLDNYFVDGACLSEIDCALLSPFDGQYSAQALVNIIFDKFTPCAKLSRTLYCNVQQIFADQKLDLDLNNYKLGVLVNYKRYELDNRKQPYCFGYGLSYSKVTYKNISSTDGIISFDIKNNSKRRLTEVVQMYVGKSDSAVLRPIKELCEFMTIELQANESRHIEIPVDLSRISTYSQNELKIEQGDYQIYIATSLLDSKLKHVLHIDGVELPKDNQLMIDYLPNLSNIVQEGYTVGTIRPVSQKFKSLILYSALSFVIFLICAIALYVLRATMASLVSQSLVDVPIYISLAMIIASVLVAIGSTIMWKWLKKRTKSLTPEKEDAKISPEQKFDLLFNSFEEQNDVLSVEEKQGNQASLDNTLKYCDSKMTSEEVCQKMQQFFADNGITLSENSAAKILASFISSRMIILGLADKTNTEKFVEVLSKFFDNDSHIIDCNKVTHTYELLSSSDGKESPLSTAIKSAMDNPTKVHFALLKDVKLQNLDTLLLPFADYVANPSIIDTVSYANAEGNVESINISSNMWICMTLSPESQLEQISSNLAENLCFINVRYTYTDIKMQSTEKVGLTAYQMFYFAENVRENVVLDEDRFWKNIDKLSNAVKEGINYVLVNKTLVALEKYAAVLLVNGVKIETVLENTVGAHVLLPILCEKKQNPEGEHFNLVKTLIQTLNIAKLDECQKLLDAVGLH